MNNSDPNSGVTKDKDIFGGEPILTGTQTPVRAIIEMRRLSYSPAQILLRLRHLNLEQVDTAIKYYEDNRAEVDAYIKSKRVPHYLIESLVKNM
ncbi:MAG: DUF433 domain-containing protein [Pyrinomonadaceae bacterium]